MQENEYTEGGIYYKHWPAETGPKAVILIVHGLGEHCCRYQAFATLCNKDGYAVMSIDLPSHGHSKGKRGHIERFDDFNGAILKLYTKIKQEYPDKDVILFGHSMGGLISTRILIQHQELFKAASLSGAAIQSPQEPPKWQVSIIRFIAKFMPKLGVLKLDASGISRDQKVVDVYMNDPLVNKGKLTAKFLVEMFKAMEDAKANAHKIKLPIRIMHGSNDNLTAPEGSELLHELVSSEEKELKIYQGLMHEILNEPEGEDIGKEIIQWLNSQIEPASKDK